MIKPSGLTVGIGPHIHGGNTTSNLIYNQIGALLPAAFAGMYVFGLKSIWVVFWSIASAIFFEYLMLKALKRPAATLLDGHAILTGLLLAMMLPADAPWWIACMGSGIAIVIGKMLFGGMGCYPFNPALVGWIVMLVSYKDIINKFPRPNHEVWGGIAESLPAQTTLEILKRYGVDMAGHYNIIDLFLGYQPGGLGAVAGLAITLGGLYLIIRKIIRWEIPVSFIAGLIAMSGIFWIVSPDRFASPLFHLVSGSTLLCIFFLAPDYSASPNTRWGRIIFGFGCGALAILIRIYGTYPNGSSRFAIMLMCLTIPLLDRIRPHIPGFAKPGKEAAADA
ncbi:MAG TPA: RnfABCDGE type electron transport complex subunit D [bacterium]|nr:RnfABCDGE type electron transport complex subunit D [bacterium]